MDRCKKCNSKYGTDGEASLQSTVEVGRSDGRLGLPVYVKLQKPGHYVEKI
jgi:hypothetical protein